MRHKPVPPVPGDVSRLAELRAAVPLVPREEESCCVRLIDRAGVPAEDEARTWLTFLAALDLVDETDEGFVRPPEDPDCLAADPTAPGDDRDAPRGDSGPPDLADRFMAGVYGARELQDLLRSSGPLTAGAAFEAFREHVPRWERHRSEDWERTWRTRVERLLDWSVLFGLAVRDGEEYAPA